MHLPTTSMLDEVRGEAHPTVLIEANALSFICQLLQGK